MFTSTFELITLVASNSHILFCFCNLIIAILLIGTKPVFSNFHPQVTIPPPLMVHEGSHNAVDYNDKSTNITGASVTQSVTDVDDTDQDHETVHDENESDDKQNVTTHINKENEEEVEEGEDGRDGDELRRRVEEFIDKINNAWKAEKLGHIPIYST